MDLDSVSKKRESFVRIDGENKRVRDDAKAWFNAFREARGYSVQQAWEYIVLTARNFIPIKENVTLQDVANRGEEVRN